jgi:hypothetical protein
MGHRLSDVHQLQTALELFYNDNGGYPAATSATIGGITGVGTVAAGATATTNGTTWSTYFANTWPTAAAPADGTCTNGASQAANNNVYNYVPGGTVSNGVYPTYNLTFCTGATTGGLSAGPHTASQAGIN